MPLIYIVTNPWMEIDFVYKIGRSDMGSIDKLMQQYSSRYLPKKKLIAEWTVQSGIVAEELIFDELSKHSSITHVEGEWYQGPINLIISLIEYVLVQISTSSLWKEWPLNMVSNRRLKLLLKDEGIINPFPQFHPYWNESSIYLMEHIQQISVLDNTIENDAFDIFHPLGINRINILPFLYVHMFPTGAYLDTYLTSLGYNDIARKDAIKDMKKNTLVYLGYLTNVTRDKIEPLVKGIDPLLMRKNEMIEYVRNPTNRDEIEFRSNVRRSIPKLKRVLEF